MTQKLPACLAGAKDTPTASAQAINLLEGMNAGNWWTVRGEVLSLLKPCVPVNQGGDFFGGSAA